MNGRPHRHGCASSRSAHSPRRNFERTVDDAYRHVIARGQWRCPVLAAARSDAQHRPVRCSLQTARSLPGVLRMQCRHSVGVPRYCPRWL
jgi:hypothetical protein